MGHLDAVGLHGVARAIVEVAHVGIIKVGHALLDHLASRLGDLISARPALSRDALAAALRVPPAAGASRGAAMGARGRIRRW